MSRRKGEIGSRQKLRDWPHHVWTEMPDGGFGQRLNAMYEFCHGRDHQVAPAGARRDKDGMWWCFREAADADAFRAWFAGTSVEGSPAMERGQA